MMMMIMKLMIMITMPMAMMMMLCSACPGRDRRHPAGNFTSLSPGLHLDRDHDAFDEDVYEDHDDDAGLHLDRDHDAIDDDEYDDNHDDGDDR